MRQKYALSKTLKIVVLCGGGSAEAKISLKSGRAVYQALKRIGFEVSRINPARTKNWWTHLKGVDVVFIALHGRGGEDGTIQLKLDRLGIPYVGSDAQGCHNSFSKKVTKMMLVRNGISTPPSVVVSSKTWEKRLKTFKLPLFAKPLEEGSSIGTFCIEDLAKNAVKINQGLRLYSKLLVEKKIEGREMTVGVLGKKALPVIELRPKRSFYDYKAKYTKGMTRYLVPAPISRKLSAKLKKMALKVHQVLRLRDMSRIDFMVDENERPFVLEANTIPGFTEFSLLPKAAKECGISFEQLCYRLVEFAHQRAKQR